MNWAKAITLLFVWCLYFCAAGAAKNVYEFAILSMLYLITHYTIWGEK